MMRPNKAWTAWVVGVAALAALGATGCHRRGGPIRDARMERYTQNMLREAARDTGCALGQLTPTQIASQPAVFTVTGCTAPIEYWLQCGSRNRHCRWQNVPMLNESATASLSCDPQLIQQQPTQAPNVRYATGCGRTAPFTMSCNGAACGWSQTGPVQGASPTVAQPPSGGVVVVPQQQAQAVPPPQQPVQAPPNALQVQVQAQREAILSCVDDGSLNLRLRWTADGQVIIQLPPSLIGTAAEGCIQAVLGGMRVQAQASGEVVVPIQ